ncbi:unnamed protein product [Arctia plantaginis]|uniref:Uncharacterized protein n=1 Tax=Arctia plantaginis TaxID=874455 RepID=A0A8S1AH78_ARCPL|nr:unnamed protein product [Arctia plantaginis]
MSITADDTETVRPRLTQRVRRGRATRRAELIRMNILRVTVRTSCSPRPPCLAAPLVSHLANQLVGAGPARLG